MAQKCLESIKLSDAEFYQAIRAQIVHEDDLIAQRLSWLVSSQSFLFTAYAIVLNAPVLTRSALMARQQALIYQAIPEVAIATCMLIYCGIVGGVIAMNALRRAFQAQFSAHGPSAVPSVQGDAWTLVLGHAAPLTLPLIFSVVWLVIWLHGGI